jgi:hypothetical protein
MAELVDYVEQGERRRTLIEERVQAGLAVARRRLRPPTIDAAKLVARIGWAPALQGAGGVSGRQTEVQISELFDPSSDQRELVRYYPRPPDHFRWHVTPRNPSFQRRSIRWR